MSARQPTPEAARAALAEAARAEAPVRSGDRVFALRLLALAVAVVLASILIVVMVALPSVLGPVEAVMAGLGIAGAAALVVAAQRRQHAFTRAGNRLFTATLIFWVFWGEAVWEASTHSDWIVYTLPRPLRALHFVLTAVVIVVPLLAGAVVFRFRR